jgi:hypothetical protein
MASLHNNPENRDVQEKALLCWETSRSLKLTLRLRESTIKELRSYNNLPDSWVEEIIKLP